MLSTFVLVYFGTIPKVFFLHIAILQTFIYLSDFSVIMYFDIFHKI